MIAYSILKYFILFKFRQNNVKVSNYCALSELHLFHTLDTRTHEKYYTECFITHLILSFNSTYTLLHIGILLKWHILQKIQNEAREKNKIYLK